MRPSSLVRTSRFEAHQGSAPHAVHGGMTTVGEVDNARNGFDPHTILTDWDTGTSRDGRRRPDACATFEIVAEDKEIEIAPGLFFPAWTYNGRVPGPTLRATEGDRLRIVFAERRLAPAQHALPRHPRGADGRRAGCRR